MKTAFLYVGQGSQKVGMGQELFDASPKTEEIFKRASDALGWDVKELCLQDPKGIIDETKWTQPALLTCSYAAHNIALEKGFKPDYVMGLSLGEYSALVANEGLSLEEGVKLVHQRGTIMQEAVPQGVGTMYAVLGLDLEGIQAVCDKHSSKGVIAPANINCPGQIVIGGQKEVVDGAIEDLKAAGAKRCIELNVAGPFHTKMLEGASNDFKKELEKYDIKFPSKPLVSNTTGDVFDKGDIKDNLAKQMYCSVQLEKGIKKLLDLGVKQFIELGPNKVLTGFIKKTARHYEVEGVEAFNIEERLG